MHARCSRAKAGGGLALSMTACTSASVCMTSCLRLKPAERMQMAPNAHVSATLSGLIHANVSGVVGSGSSFTTTVLFLPYRHVPRCLLWDLD